MTEIFRLLQGSQHDPHDLSGSAAGVAAPEDAVPEPQPDHGYSHRGLPLPLLPNSPVSPHLSLNYSLLMEQLRFCFF